MVNMSSRECKCKSNIGEKKYFVYFFTKKKKNIGEKCYIFSSKMLQHHILHQFQANVRLKGIRILLFFVCLYCHSAVKLFVESLFSLGVHPLWREGP